MAGSALGAAAGAVGGAADLISAVGNLLPSTTTASGHTESKSSALSDTISGEINVGKNSTVGTETSTGKSNSRTAGSGSEVGTNKSSTINSGVSNENFSGQSNTTTTQTMLTQEGAMRIVNMLLQGNGGIAGLQETVGGERNAGIYNSSTNTLLTSNLLSTIAGEVARLSAPTVATQNLGATTTQTTSNTSSLMDAVTNAITNMDQSTSGSESKSSQSTQDVLNLVLGLAEQFTKQESESVTDNKTKTKTKKFPSYICTFLQKTLPDHSGAKEFELLEDFKGSFLVPERPFTAAKYNKIAPPIVEELEKLPDAIKLIEAERIRKEFIVPAAKAYESGDSAEALGIYSDMVYSLQDTYIKGV